LSQWDARIVMHFRHYPLSEEYCDAIKTMLEDTQKKGWSAVTKQAAKGKNEVKMDYKPCP